MSTDQAADQPSVPSTRPRDETASPETTNNLAPADSTDPRKRARLSPKPNILSLPDEPIFRIMYYLKASDTRGILDKPRHAFALAQTNTRLLKIFRSHLVCITPDIHHAYAPILTSRHLFSVVWLAGHCLQELHLPSFATEILRFLPKTCPRLEKLSLDESVSIQRPRNTYRYERTAFVKHGRDLIPQLRSLSIVRPRRQTFDVLNPPPPELVLKTVTSEVIPYIPSILRHPLKKLYLQFERIEPVDAYDLLPILHRACSNIEDLTVIEQWGSECMFISPHPPRDTFDNFMDHATRFLNTPRWDRNSMCMRMAIDVQFRDLIRRAHPKALLEVTQGSETFVKNGDEVYAKRLPLIDEYLTQDLSRLEEVYAPEGSLCRQQWRENLTGRKLSLARLDDCFYAAEVCQNVEVIETEAMYMKPHINWQLPTCVREVRVLGTCFEEYSDYDHAQLLPSLANLLYDFCGEVVSIYDFQKLYITEANDPLLRSMMRIIANLKRFEARGGHAPSVRVWAMHDHAHLDLLWRSSFESIA